MHDHINELMDFFTFTKWKMLKLFIFHIFLNEIIILQIYYSSSLLAISYLLITLYTLIKFEYIFKELNYENLKNKLISLKFLLTIALCGIIGFLFIIGIAFLQFLCVEYNFLYKILKKSYY